MVTMPKYVQANMFTHGELACSPMNLRSRAASKTGRYVRGRTTTANMTAYSTIVTGSGTMMAMTIATMKIASHDSVKRGTSRMGLDRPHGQSKYWHKL